MKNPFLAMLAATSTLCGAAVVDSTVILRDGSRIVIGDASAAGVTMPAEAGRPARVISWSQVRSVDGPLRKKFDENKAIANELWRAVSRLKRRDPGGADSILEALWKATEGTTGPTRAEIAAGLLACRAWRGASASAVRPWAEWIDQSLSLDSESAGRIRGMIENLEPGDIWLSSMPPIWVDSPAVRELAMHSGGADMRKDAGHPSGADVLEIYAVAARRDSGQSWGIDPAVALKDPAWANIAGAMVLAESDTASVRAESRQRLIANLSSDTPIWRQAWVRLGIGRSLLLEDGAEDRRNGVLSLLWVASRPQADPGLAAIALADAARGLMLLNDAPGALAVLADLERRFPEDPILESMPVSMVRKSAGPAKASPQSAPAGPGAPGAPVSLPTKSDTTKENAK